MEAREKRFLLGADGAGYNRILLVSRCGNSADRCATARKLLATKDSVVEHMARLVVNAMAGGNSACLFAKTGIHSE